MTSAERNWGIGVRRELAVKRKRILKRISLEEYRGLLGFVERVYLSEYALKVLLARKCSNLFFGLVELAREEDGGRVRRLYQQKFAEGNTPLIISDRAVCYFREAIKAGRFASILIVDDVMIHGKTVAQLYGQIQPLVEGQDCKIDIWAYAANRNEVLPEILKSAKVDRQCETSEWRGITDKIVDIFYLTGRPYTSYVPNLILDISSGPGKAMEDFRRRHVMERINNTFQKEEDIFSYAWIDPDRWNFSVFRSIRFYMNEELEKCVVVPMVSLMPVWEDVFFQYVDILKEFICKEYFEKVFPACRELCYRMIIYVISALWGRLFFEKYVGSSVEGMDLESPLEEEVNFGGRILDRERIRKLSAGQIEEIADRLEKAYKEVDSGTLRSLSPDFQILEEETAHIPEQEKGENQPLQIMSFLYINAKKEEERWKAGQSREGMAGRLGGYPLCCIPDRFSDGSRNDILMQVLHAIDLGYGSIVAMVYNTEAGCCYVSLLHSGERNYKYVEMRYFPFLYGLFEIEKGLRDKKQNDEGQKRRFMEEYISKVGGTCTKYAREDLNKLCGTNVTEAYRSVLIRDAWSYSDQDALRAAIEVADGIMQ